MQKVSDENVKHFNQDMISVTEFSFCLRFQGITSLALLSNLWVLLCPSLFSLQLNSRWCPIPISKKSDPKVRARRCSSPVYKIHDHQYAPWLPILRIPSGYITVELLHFSLNYTKRRGVIFITISTELSDWNGKSLSWSTFKFTIWSVKTWLETDWTPTKASLMQDIIYLGREQKGY